MKTRAALVAGALLISGSLALPTPGFTRDDDHDNGRTERYDRRDYNGRDARDLQGTWYMNGDRNKRTEINGNGRNLQARNGCVRREHAPVDTEDPQRIQNDFSVGLEVP